MISSKIISISSLLVGSIFIMKLFINADSTCGSTTSCNVPHNGSVNVRMDVGPFKYFSGPPGNNSNIDIRFDYGLCLPWQEDKYGSTQLMDWTQVFYNSFTVFIRTETTDCSSDVTFSYVRYCSQTGSITANNLDYYGTSLGYWSPPSYNNPYSSSIYVYVPRDRPFKVTMTLYTRCDYCNKDDLSNKYNLVFQAVENYSANAWNNTGGKLNFTILKPLNCVIDDPLMSYTAHQSATPWNHCSSNSCN